MMVWFYRCIILCIFVFGWSCWDWRVLVLHLPPAQCNLTEEKSEEVPHNSSLHLDLSLGFRHSSAYHRKARRIYFG